MTPLPEAAPTNGAAELVHLEEIPKPPFPGQWIVLGPRTRAQLARVLEQTPFSAAVLVALLETSGVPEGMEYQLVVGGAHLEPVVPKG